MSVCTHLADLKRTTIPVKTIVHGLCDIRCTLAKRIVRRLTDGLLRVLRRLKDYSTRTLGSSVRTNVDIGTNDISGRPEEILQVLPSSLVGQLEHTSAQTKNKREVYIRCQRKAGYRDWHRTRNNCATQGAAEARRVTPGPPLPCLSCLEQGSLRIVIRVRDPDRV